MKKNFLILSLVFLISLALTGCGNKEASPQNKTAQKLSDWIASGKGVVCSVDTPQGEVIVKAKGKKVRMDGIMYMDMTSSNASHGMQKGTSITNGDWFYMWGEKTGVKMNIKEMEQMGEDDKDDYNIAEEDYSATAWAEAMEDAQVSYDCREENISDSEFQAPDNINFADLSEIFKNMQKFGQDMINKNDNDNNT